MKNFTFLSLILLFLIKTQNIYAKESTFTVDNILVSSELTNINNSSREKYLNIGFKKGFKNLVINLLRKEDQKKILIGITFFVTLIGLLIYLGMKKIEYGNQFTYPLFFLGKSSCSNNLLGNLKTIKEVNVRNITRFSVDLKNVLFFVKSAFTR